MLKISIITPVYNGEQTIQKTIQSIRDQRYENLEYIVVDGLSTDKTEDIVRQNNDFIHHYIREKDEGIYDAINKGINVATGDLICICNADDQLTKGCIDLVLNRYKYNPDSIIHGNIILMKNGLNFKIIEPILPLSDYVFVSNPLNHPGMFIPRKIYVKHGVYRTDLKIAGDCALLYRFYKKGIKFEYINEPLARFGTEGISSINRIEGLKESLNNLYEEGGIPYYYLIYVKYREILVDEIKKLISFFRN